MLSLNIPFKKSVKIDDFAKFEEELEELTEKYFGHSDIFVVIRDDLK